MDRLPRVAVPLAAFIGFVLSPHIADAQAARASLKELTESSHAIFTGKCVKKESSWNSTHTKIFTQVRIQTGELIKGSPGAEALITVPGGQVGTTVYEVSDMPNFMEGEEVLVFLYRHPSGKNLVTGALQGKMTIVKEKATGRRVVQGGSFLLEGTSGREVQSLQKTEAQKVQGQANKVYLDDLKMSIRAFVQQ